MGAGEKGPCALLWSRAGFSGGFPGRLRTQASSQHQPSSACSPAPGDSRPGCGGPSWGGEAGAETPRRGGGASTASVRKENLPREDFSRCGGRGTTHTQGTLCGHCPSTQQSPRWALCRVSFQSLCVCANAHTTHCAHAFLKRGQDCILN